MSELQTKNAKATKQALEAMEKRIRDIETTVQTLTGHVQTMSNLTTQIQQNNNLALARLIGTGATNGDIN